MKVRLTSVPNNEILDLSKSKAFANDKISITQKLIFVSVWIENIVGKGENAGKQHFLLFSQYFNKKTMMAWIAHLRHFSPQNESYFIVPTCDPQGGDQF